MPEKRAGRVRRKAPVPASQAIREQPPSEFTSAAEFFPARKTLKTLAAAALGCRACDLWRTGTQTVFGEGNRKADVLFVGEQPGDQEDLEGRPFVGPAGKLFDSALAEAGIDRDQVYVTNAVKHFKWERGEKSSRRIHKKPNDSEVRACIPWLEQEIAQLKPSVIVCLGATAAQALLGKSFKVTQQRGKPVKSTLAKVVVATVHPSSVLRAPTPEARRQANADLIADLKVVAKHI